MKKTIFFIIFLVFAIFLFDKFYISGFSILKIGENSTEISGKTVTIKQISQGNVIVDVDGDSEIISEGEFKVINEVKITVEEVFYVAEKEDRFVKLTLALYAELKCGDDKCDKNETKESCCTDCGCSFGYVCESNRCSRSKNVTERNECDKDTECDDKNELTIDKCSGTPKKCSHITYYQCKTNEDCDDKKECTKDDCIAYECFNKEIPNCIPQSKEAVGTEKNEESPATMTQQKSFLSRLIDKLFGWL